MAVADAFYSMVSDYEYQPAVSWESAMTELRACAGTQFDPWVVGRFVQQVLPARWPSAEVGRAG